MYLFFGPNILWHLRPKFYKKLKKNVSFGRNRVVSKINLVMNDSDEFSPDAGPFPYLYYYQE